MFCLSVLPQVADLKLKRAKWDTAEFHNFWVSLHSPATSLSVASGWGEWVEAAQKLARQRLQEVLLSNAERSNVDDIVGSIMGLEGEDLGGSFLDNLQVDDWPIEQVGKTKTLGRLFLVKYTVALKTLPAASTAAGTKSIRAVLELVPLHARDPHDDARSEDREAV